MILAARHGWEAIRGPGPLTFREARLSLQLLVEEEIGAPREARAQERKAAENAAFGAAVGQSR